MIGGNGRDREVCDHVALSDFVMDLSSACLAVSLALAFMFAFGGWEVSLIVIALVMALLALVGYLSAIVILEKAERIAAMPGEDSE